MKGGPKQKNRDIKIEMREEEDCVNYTDKPKQWHQFRVKEGDENYLILKF